MWTPPVVDMASASAAKDIVEVGKSQGFFYMENHEIPDEVMRQVFEQSKAFFALSKEDKLTVKADKKNRGFTPMHEEILDPKNQAKGDTKEGYYIFREVEADSQETKEPLTGPNQWPAEHLVPGWKDTMTDYYDRMHALGVRLTDLLAEGLGLDTSHFHGCFSRSMSALRLLHYSPEVSNPDSGVMGAGAHSDYGLVTMLATDEVPGLQVLVDGEWIDVPPRPGAFICNLGDLLQRWTNDHLRSTVHRVVNKLGRERYSIPFFFDPNFDTEVTCLPPFCSEDEPAKYPSISSGQYVMDKYSQTHQDFDKNQKK